MNLKLILLFLIGNILFTSNLLKAELADGVSKTLGLDLIKAERLRFEYKELLKKGFTPDQTNMLPALIQAFNDDVSCMVPFGDGGAKNGTFLSIKSDAKSNGLICSSNSGNFRLCTFPYIICTSGTLGLLDLQSLDFVLPANQECSSADPKTALLNSSAAIL